MKSLLTQKIGMTRVISESGQFVPVTVLQVPQNSVLQVKTPGKRWVLCRRRRRAAAGEKKY